jgi:hypothetical protein
MDYTLRIVRLQPELKDLKSRLSKLANEYISEDFEVCIVLINGLKQ